jgi:DNA-binding NarL/FixJ family response regulator
VSSRAAAPGAAPITILLVDDHVLFRQGLRRILEDEPDFTVVGEAADGGEAVALAARLRPDLVLMDVKMPGIGGAEATRRIRAAQPETRVIMLTVSARDEDLFASVRAGARGYLLKNARLDQVVEALHRARAGEALIAPAMAGRLLDEFGVHTARATGPSAPPGDLTPREIEVLRLVAQGLPNKQIAERIDCSEHTVKTHLRHILDKLHMRNRAQAAVYAAQAGLLPKKPRGA